eukprot:15338090-Ditylum_brightwellii.AAC.1
MILQQIKESTDHSFWLVKDVPGQIKPTDTDESSVLTQTTQGVSKDSLSDSEAITISQSEEEVCLLTQVNVEKQRNTKLEVKSNTKSNQFPKKLNQGKMYCCKIDAFHKSMAIPKKQVRTRRRLILGEKVHNNAI